MTTKEQKRNDIIDFLNQLGSRIDQSTLNQCESDSIIELYASLMERLGVINKSDLQIEFSQMKLFKTANLHQRPIYILKLGLLMQRFLSKILSIDNFTCNDLFNPNPKKTRTILRALMKYYQFKTNEENHIKEIKETITNSINEVNQSQENLSKIEELFEQLNNKDIEVTKPEINVIMDKVSSIEKLIIETNETNRLNGIENEQLINYSKELDDKLRLSEQFNVTYEDKIKKLKGQVVSSPDKMEAMVAEKQNQIDIMMKEINNMEGQLLTFDNETKNIDMSNIAFKEYGNVWAGIEEIRKENDEFNMELTEKKEAKKMKESVLKSIEEKIANIKMAIMKFDDYHKENDVKRIEGDTILHNNLTQMKENESLMKQKIENDIKTHEDIIANINRFRENNTNVEIIREEYGNEMMKQMENLYNGAKEYKAKMMKMIEIAYLNDT